MICFCCGELVMPAITMEIDDDWQIPQGLHFVDNGNYGSEVHDSLQGDKYEIIVCDLCLKKNWQRGRIRRPSDGAIF